MVNARTDLQVLLQDVQEEALEASQTRCKQAPCTSLPTRASGADILSVCIENTILGALAQQSLEEGCPHSNSGAASTLREMTLILSPNTHVCIAKAALFSKQWCERDKMSVQKNAVAKRLTFGISSEVGLK